MEMAAGSEEMKEGVRLGISSSSDVVYCQGHASFLPSSFEKIGKGDHQPLTTYLGNHPGLGFRIPLGDYLSRVKISHSFLLDFKYTAKKP